MSVICERFGMPTQSTPGLVTLEHFGHVTNMLLRPLLAYWLRKRSGRLMPSRTDIDAVDIPCVLSRIWLCDYLPESGHFRYRLAGQQINTVGSESWPRWPTHGANVLLSFLITGLSACAPLLFPGGPPDTITEEHRTSFGVVGVVSVSFSPEKDLYHPTAGRGAKKGALQGAATGLDVGFDAIRESGSGSFCSGDATACAVLLGATLVLLPVLVVGGTIVGSISGAIDDGNDSIPDDSVVRIENQMIRVLAEERPQETLRQRIVEIAKLEKVSSVTELKNKGPAKPDGPVDYAYLAAEGVNTVLEIAVLRIGLSGKRDDDPELVLFLQARVRVVDAQSNEVFFNNQTFLHVSQRRKFTEWGANNAQPLQEEMDRGYRLLSEKIVDDIFLETHWN